MLPLEPSTVPIVLIFVVASERQTNNMDQRPGIHIDPETGLFYLVEATRDFAYYWEIASHYLAIAALPLLVVVLHACFSRNK